MITDSGGFQVGTRLSAPSALQPRSRWLGSGGSSLPRWARADCPTLRRRAQRCGTVRVTGTGMRCALALARPAAWAARAGLSGRGRNAQMLTTEHSTDQNGSPSLGGCPSRAHAQLAGSGTSRAPTSCVPASCAAHGPAARALQVFSLAYGTVHEEVNSLKRGTGKSRHKLEHNLVCRVTEEGVTFRSYR